MHTGGSPKVMNIKIAVLSVVLLYMEIKDVTLASYTNTESKLGGTFCYKNIAR